MSPIAVIHFLGGAFVGAAPHLTYRYLLESLANRGYLIVATPYRLNFDYIQMCESILSKFDIVAIKLAGMYGPIPVIGIGHSGGALLQVLITSLFPDAPRAVNILLSVNNRPAKVAIPLFDEVIVPFCEQVMRDADKGGSSIKELVTIARSIFDQTVANYANLPITPKFIKNEILPIFEQGLEIIDQMPTLFQQIYDGKREFDPSPRDTKEVCRRMYRARKTLLIRFDNDNLDDSPEFEKVLKEANTIMRMKRPMVEMEVEMRNMTGSHLTPLTQNIILEPPKNIPQTEIPIPDPFMTTRNELKTNFLRTINEVAEEITDFLDKSISVIPML